MHERSNYIDECFRIFLGNIQIPILSFFMNGRSDSKIRLERFLEEDILIEGKRIGIQPKRVAVVSFVTVIHEPNG